MTDLMCVESFILVNFLNLLCCSLKHLTDPTESDLQAIKAEHFIRTMKLMLFQIVFLIPGRPVNTIERHGLVFLVLTQECISLNENFWILNKISLKYVPSGPIGNMAALVQIMARQRKVDKPLSESTMV